MVSGLPLFIALFNNLAIFIALVAVYGAMAATFAKPRGYSRQLAIGLVFGLFAVGCMNAKIPVYEGVIVDQRNAIVALSGAFGGPLAAIVSAAAAAAYRAHLGGSGVLSGVTGIGLAAASGVAIYTFVGRIDTVRKSATLSAIATAVILPGFVLVGTWRTGWDLMLAMAVPYGTAIFLGIFLVSLMLAREDRRHQAEQRFRQMVAIAPEAIIVVDRSRKIRLFNARAEACSGISAEQAIGQVLSEQSWLDAKAHAHIEQRIALAERTGGVSGPVGLSLGGESEFEVTVAPIFSAGGEKEWVISLLDVTARNRAQQARLDFEARIMQSQSLESLGRLAGGVAHDFNNMLSVVLGTTDLLKMEHQDDRALVEDLQMIDDAATKAAELTSQLLAFGRKQVLEPQVLDPNRVVRGLVSLLQRSMPENIELRVSCAERVPNVTVDIARLEQVIVNLVVNARDAMPQGGRLTIGTCEREVDAAYAGEHSDVVPGRYVEIAVSDTGHGMTDEVRTRIFEPFYTTKTHGKGTGLGLATVHGIVRQSGGHIQVYSEPGRGSSFRVYLPCTEAEPTVVGEEYPLRHEEFSGRVLLVEDNDLVRDRVGRMLTALGFRVTETGGGEEAIAAFLAAAEPFELVLTDVVLRDISGPELVAELRRRRPDTRVLFMSGYTENAMEGAGALEHNASFISKPFTRKGLETAIAKVYARAPKAGA